VKKRSGEAFFHSFIDFQKRQPRPYRNPGHLASRSARGGSCRDVGHHGANPGHPG